jgi:UDP-3-O-acyl-N-acetylglucosamine deacetylase
MGVSVTVLGLNGENNVEGVETIAGALAAAGISAEVSVRIDGENVPQDQYDQPVEDGDVITTAAPELKGGH